MRPTSMPAIDVVSTRLASGRGGPRPAHFRRRFEVWNTPIPVVLDLIRARDPEKSRLVKRTPEYGDPDRQAASGEACRNAQGRDADDIGGEALAGRSPTGAATPVGLSGPVVGAAPGSRAVGWVSPPGPPTRTLPRRTAPSSA